MKQMNESVMHYISEMPTATLSDLTGEFGTPSEIAKSFLEEADPAVVGKSLRFGRRIFWAVLAVAVLVGVLVSAIYFVDYLENQDYRRGHYVETFGELPSIPEKMGSDIQIY